MIKRMASNSFMLKGWTITLVVLSLLVKGNKTSALIAIFPLLMFWFLDAYFLRQERLFRELYKWVVNNRQKTDEHLFDMGTQRFEEKVQSIFGTMLSITLRWFYGSIAVLILIFYLFLPNGGM